MVTSSAHRHVEGVEVSVLIWGDGSEESGEAGNIFLGRLPY